MPVNQPAGIVAVIHKATEADDFHDSQYHKRRAQAKGAGLLWGAYHFAGPPSVDGTKQADFFLDSVEPEEDEFLCFDCEKHGTLANMEAFVRRVRDKAGRYPAIYGRRLLRELMHGNSGSVAASGVLWYDEYPAAEFSVPQQHLPEGWGEWTLWQYTDGHNGSDPKSAPGIGNCDRSAFKGTQEELVAAWPFRRT